MKPNRKLASKLLNLKTFPIKYLKTLPARKYPNSTKIQSILDRLEKIYQLISIKIKQAQLIPLR